MLPNAFRPVHVTVMGSVVNGARLPFFVKRHISASICFMIKGPDKLSIVADNNEIGHNPCDNTKWEFVSLVMTVWIRPIKETWGLQPTQMTVGSTSRRRGPGVLNSQ
jgi:hypothetical protein